MSLAVKETLAPSGIQFTADGTFTFPSGVTKVRAYLWGGGGKTGTQAGGVGGAGAYVAVDIPKGNRTTLTIYLNKGGGACGPVNGGGFGGGYSAVYTATDTYIAIAAGGGGTGNNYFGGGGGFYNASQGGNATQVGTISTSNNYSHGGGASQSAGGAGGISPFNATFYSGNPGTSLQGGNAQTGTGFGGGGGGGYYGGGGGGGDANVSPYTGMGAGGGGSSYVSAAGTVVEGQAGPNGATGGVNPGGRTSGYYTGTYGASNQNGLVVIVPYLPAQQIPPRVRMANVVPVRQTSVFLGTGAVQTFTVPPNVFGIRVFLWGAGGIASGSTGGGGGYVEATLPTVPGQVYSIIVGRSAQTGLANGGGSLGNGGGGGGGFSGIFSATPSAGTVIVIAGGGGGSGLIIAGGGGGYPNGLDAVGGNGSNGGGGTQTAGGAGGFWVYKGGNDGTQLAGGDAGTIQVGGGGGGGGWWGGGGGFGPVSVGYAGGGGGGSSTYKSPAINVVTANGTNSGIAGGSTTQYWISPYGSSGQNGLVVIGYTTSIPTLQYTPYSPTFRSRSSFYGTGTVQSFTVPAGVTLVRIFCWGSGGIGQNGVSLQVAGSGAYAAASYRVSPGQVLSIVVGRPGQAGVANGGGSTGGTSANGGGFSGVFTSNSPSQFNTLLIAGAGAGSGFNGGGVGGGGGYPAGNAGVGTQSQGRGGTQTSGGTSSATAGSQLTGGNGGGGDQGGGGGGGGWFGGGGGINQGGGGGGSSYAAPVLRATEFFSGNNGGTNGANPTLAANEASPYWQTPYGRAGQNGLVVIAY